MKFLRGILGGGDGADQRGGAAADEAADEVAPETDDSERQRDLALLREEQARHSDLAQRQQRYAQYAWQPPKQGGDRRADDKAEE